MGHHHFKYFTQNVFVQLAASSAVGLRVVAELEDITTSIDVHDTYIKTKSKLGAASVSHHPVSR